MDPGTDPDEGFVTGALRGPTRGPAGRGAPRLARLFVCAALGLWAAGPTSAATLSPSLSNCYPECELRDMRGPLDPEPLQVPDIMAPGDSGLGDYVDKILTAPVDTGAVPVLPAPEPDLDIPPVEGPIR